MTKIATLDTAKQGTTLGATLLITGCCIGAGMLGLPVISATTGLIPSTLAMIACYLFATTTGLLILEATLWFDQKVNLLSMANFTLGKKGKFLTWSFYLFLFYCLFVAYIEGGGQLFSKLLSSLFQITLSREVGIIAAVTFVGVIVSLGTILASRISNLFLFLLLGAYFVLVSFGIPHIQGQALLYTNWMAAISTMPILLVCFGYQNLVPTLTYYVKRNVSAIQKAIFIGNLIPFLIYFLWNFVILGLLDSPKTIISQNGMVTNLLTSYSHSQSVFIYAGIFSFFAIFTSFIANTMTFVDFLKDGLKMRTKSKYSFLVYLLVFIPPTLFTLFYSDLFLKALSFAGGFADIILFGILPVIIVWIGRYVKKASGPYKVFGGKPLLIVILLFCVSLLLVRS